MDKKYLRMVRAMKKTDAADWSVYILKCGDGTLYTGVAKDVPARLKKHCAGKGAAYTRTHLPVILMYQENSLTRSEALMREAAIKRLPRSQKHGLIAAKNDSMIKEPA